MDNETEVEQGPVAVLTGLSNSGQPFTNLVDLYESGDRFLRGSIEVGKENDSTLTSIELYVNGKKYESKITKHARRADSLEIFFARRTEKLTLWWEYRNQDSISTYEDKVDVKQQ